MTDRRYERASEYKAGNRRIRAYIPDEDGYAGWVENSSFVGLAEVTDSQPPHYVAERFFPHKQGKPVYLWDLTPETGELGVKAYDTQEVTAPLDVYTPADNDHIGYFVNLVSALRYAFRGSDYAKLWPGQEYSYELPELQ